MQHILRSAVANMLNLRNEIPADNQLPGRICRGKNEYPKINFKLFGAG